MALLALLYYLMHILIMFYDSNRVWANGLTDHSLSKPRGISKLSP